MDKNLTEMLLELSKYSPEGVSLDLVAYWVHDNFFKNEIPKDVNVAVPCPQHMPKTFELIELAVNKGFVRKIPTPKTFDPPKVVLTVALEVINAQ